MGAKTINEGDGVFVPNGRPYTHRAGPGGVEVIEFRSVNSFDMETLDADVDKWQRFVAIGEEMAETWQATQPQWVKDLPGQGGAVVSEQRHARRCKWPGPVVPGHCSF